MKKSIGISFICYFLVSSLISSCSPSTQSTQEAFTRTQAALPTLTSTPIPTSTPTLTPTATPSQQFEIISADNVDQIKMVHRLGRGAITVVEYSPDNSTLAIGSSIGVYLLDNEIKQEELFLDTDRIVNEIRFTPDNQIIAGACFDGSIYVWQVKDGKLLYIFNIVTGYGDYHIDISKDGSKLAASNDAGSIFIWNLTDGSQVSVFSRSQAKVLDMRFMPDGISLGVVRDDGTMLFYDFTKWITLDYVPFQKVNLLAVAISPDGAWLATTNMTTQADGHWDHEVMTLWSLTTPKTRGQSKLFVPKDPSTGLTPFFSSDGKIVAGMSNSGVVNIWDISSGKLLSVDNPDKGTNGNYRDKRTNIVFSPDGKTVAFYPKYGWIDAFTALGGRLLGGNKIDFMNLSTQEVEARYLLSENKYLEDPNNSTYILSGPTEPISSLAFSNDSRYLISYSNDGRLCLWDVNSGELVKTVQAFDHGTGKAISPNGRLVAAGGKDIVKIYSFPEIKPANAIYGVGGVVLRLAFSPDNSKLAILAVDDYENDNMSLFSISANGTNAGYLRNFIEGSKNSIAFSPDGSLIASGDDWGNIFIWNTSTGTLKSEIQIHAGYFIFGLEFSPDGSLLAAGGYSGQLAIISTTDGSALSYHRSDATALHFSLIQSILINSGIERYIDIWRIPDFVLMGHINTNTFGNHALAISSDGTLFASGSSTLVIKIWGIEK